MEKITIKDGFIDYEPYYGSEQEIIELKRIFVSEESRHTGIGTELLRELIKIANGKTIVTFSSTDPEREVFGKFLVAEGFVKTNEANATGDKWELKKLPKKLEIKVPVKKTKKKK